MNEDAERQARLVDKLLVAVKLKEQETPILASTNGQLEFSQLLANTYTVIVRGEY